MVLRVRTFAAVRICCSSSSRARAGPDPDQEDVTLLAGHRVTRLDGLDVFESGGSIIGLRRIERGDGDERRQHVSQRLGIDPRPVPRHHSAGLEPSHPRLHGRHRQARALRQVGQRGAPVGDQLAHQHPVDVVELFAGLRHGRRLSRGAARIDERRHVQTWLLRARFAAALSTMYGAEVPAYTTLVDVSTDVNRSRAQDDRLGSLDRVTAERHGAIRVGSVAELADVADLFSAFGMYPVGYYDLREAASPVPVVSTAFRPIDAVELERNPFRVFTSMLATADARFFDADLRPRVERFLGARQLFDPELIAARARDRRSDGGCHRRRGRRLRGAGGRRRSPCRASRSTPAGTPNCRRCPRSPPTSRACAPPTSTT